MVEDNLELWFGSREVEHRLAEVFAVFAIQPGCANDDVATRSVGRVAEDCLDFFFS